jgi:hypothetical protein
MIVVSEDFQIKIMFNCRNFAREYDRSYTPVFVIKFSGKNIYIYLQKTMIPKVLNLANILHTTR